MLVVCCSIHGSSCRCRSSGSASYPSQRIPPSSASSHPITLSAGGNATEGVVGAAPLEMGTKIAEGVVCMCVSINKGIPEETYIYIYIHTYVHTCIHKHVVAWFIVQLLVPLVFSCLRGALDSGPDGF